MAGVMLVTAGSAGSPLSVSVTNPFPIGFSASPGTLSTSSPTILRISGGTAPYTIDWVKTAGDDMDISSETSSSVTFYAYMPTSPDTRSASWTATVTDAASATQDVLVSVLLTVGGLS